MPFFLASFLLVPFRRLCRNRVFYPVSNDIAFHLFFIT